jgi:predicted RND superfamily exporter protein
MSSGIAPVAAIGVFAPFGVMVGCRLRLTLPPAILCLVPLGATRKGVDSERNAVDHFLAGRGRFSTRNAKPVVAGFGASQLAFSYDPLGWLDSELDIVKGTHFIDSALGDSVSFEVLLESDEDGGIRNLETPRKLETLGRNFETEEREGLVAGQTMSLTAVALSSGFFGFLLSSMTNLASMGELVSFAISMAFLAGVLLAPALLTLFDRDEPVRPAL